MPIESLYFSQDICETAFINFKLYLLEEESRAQRSNVIGLKLHIDCVRVCWLVGSR